MEKLLHFQVGNTLHSINTEEISPETTLNSFLRDKSYLTGTKKMCLEGGCGSCIVAVEEQHPKNKKKVFAVNSCLVSLFSCQGWKIHTVEGIGNALTKYHPIQETLAKKSGTQCGYCSPGMVMNMYALLKDGPVTEQQVEDSFGGNICRCTGYRPILDAFKSLANEEIVDIEEVNPCSKDNCEKTCLVPCSKKPLAFNLTKSKWIKVFFVKDLLDILRESSFSSYRLVAGNTGRGVYRETEEIATYIDIAKVEELTSFNLKSNELILGANIALNAVMDIFRSIAGKNKKFQFLSQMADHINLVANVPVRNIGTLAGNLMLKHKYPEFSSDIFLILETVDAKLVIVDVDFNETRVSPGKFLSLNMDKRVIKHIIICSYDDTYKYGSYKIMTRAQNTHALVNAGFLFKMIENTVVTARIVFGSINSKFVHALNTEKFLQYKDLFQNDVLQQSYTLLNQELNAVENPPEPSPKFRKQLAISLFYKFVLSIAPSSKITPKMKSGASLLERPLSSGSQEYTSNEKLFPVTKPIPKIEGLAQTSGEAQYVADIPDSPFQLYASFVMAKAPADSKIENIDTSIAMALKGVVAFVDKNDVPDNNTFIPAFFGFSIQEELFCSGTVKFFSQPIDVIVAKSFDLAEKASELVKVTYSNTDSKLFLNVDEVLKENVQDRITHKLDFVSKRKGNDVKKTIEGKVSLPHQAHIHMEVHTCNVYPTEDGMEIFSSTQFPDLVQLAAAATCKLSTNKVSVHVRRLGGAFGGKVFRATLISTATAVASWKLRKPVKMWMTLEKNLSIIGKRNPLTVNYKADVNDKGVIQHMEAKIYSDYGVEGGNEEAIAMMLPSFLNVYNTDTWDLSLYAVRTDMPTNCWVRAPGTTEGAAAIEAIFEHIAYEMNLDTSKVKENNIDTKKYPDFGKYVDEMKQWVDFENRKKELETFNEENRWKKKGCSLVPMCWNFEIIASYPVLISIFHGDGGVVISHGGVEMGQGVNTKATQVVAYKLNIDMDLISVKPYNTTTSPNAFGSGGSLTSEAICGALIRACDAINKKLDPIREELKKTNPNFTWADLINKAYGSGVLLMESALFSPISGIIQEYEIFAVCYAEVEVDILTGQHVITNMNIIEELGESMNPVIDVGQIEGAIVMGIGYHTKEEMIYSSKGEPLTTRTWNYRTPGPKDIPVSFKIRFSKNKSNPKGVLNSKAVAEPPMCLTVSVPLAIRNAVSSARTNANPNNKKWYPFTGTSTVENTFLNSENHYEQFTL